MEVTLSLKWGVVDHFGGGTGTVSSVIDVTLPHTPLPMVGKRYSGLRCFLLRGWCLTGTVGGVCEVYIRPGLVASGPRGATSWRGFPSAQMSLFLHPVCRVSPPSV